MNKPQKTQSKDHSHSYPHVQKDSIQEVKFWIEGVTY